jgi:hypothetical protein
MSNVTVQEALKAAIEVIEQAIPDKRGEFEEQQKLYENYPNLAYKYDYLKVEADEMQQALDKCKAALIEIDKCEPVAYIHTATNTDKDGVEWVQLKAIDTSPQPREWVSLTKEQEAEIIEENEGVIPYIIHDVSEALKQLNTKG